MEERVDDAGAEADGAGPGRHVRQRLQRVEDAAVGVGQRHGLVHADHPCLGRAQQPFEGPYRAEARLLGRLRHAGDVLRVGVSPGDGETHSEIHGVLLCCVCL